MVVTMGCKTAAQRGQKSVVKWAASRDSTRVGWTVGCLADMTAEHWAVKLVDRLVAWTAALTVVLKVGVTAERWEQQKADNLAALLAMNLAEMKVCSLVAVKAA